MLVKLSNVLEIVGVLLVVVAALAWDWRAFAALLGVVMVVAGYLMDPAVEGEQ